VNITSVTRFHHFTLATRDVIASRDFFVDTFGLKVVRRPGNIEMEAAWLELADGVRSKYSDDGMGH
jgi:catechol 2,3-dioxygenase-like lactoylglutathione lyase family enzyme